MRSTLIPLALALGSLSAPLSGAFARTSTATIDSAIYACVEPELTEAYYRLAVSDAPEDAGRRHRWVADAETSTPRMCRFFEKVPTKGRVNVILPDAGESYAGF